MDYNIIQGVCNLTSTGGNFTGTLPIKYTSYKDGGIYICKTDANSGADSFLNLNNIGNTPIVSFCTTDVSLIAFSWYFFLYEKSTNQFYALNHSLGI